MHALAEAIFAVEFPRPVAVPTPEWPAINGKVFVRALSAAERDAYELTLRDDDNEPDLSNVRARLVVLAACDADGKRIFGDGDAATVGKQPASVIYRLWDQSRRSAGMVSDDEQGRIGELAKNSAATEGGDSPSS